MAGHMEKQLAFALVLLGLVGLPAHVQAQPAIGKPPRIASAGADPAPPSPAAPEPKAPELTLEVLQMRLKQAAEVKDIPDDLRKQMIDLFQRAKEQLKVADDLRKKTREREAQRASAPDQIQEIKRELIALAADPVIAPDASASVAALEKALADTEAKLDDSRKQAGKWSAEIKRRADRRLEIPKLISVAKERLEKEQKEFEAKPPEKEIPEFTRARRFLIAANKQQLENEIDGYAAETRWIDATGELLSLCRDRANRQASHLQKEVTLWREAVNHQRKLEADRAAQHAKEQEADLAATDSDPRLRSLAEENAGLAKRRAELVSETAHAATELEATRKHVTHVQDEFKSVTEKIKQAGMSHALGLYLFKQAGKLPDLRRHRKDIERRQTLISHAQSDWIDLEETRNGLSDVEGTAQKLLAAGSAPVDAAGLEAQLLKLLHTKRDTLDALINDYSRYYNLLVDLDDSDRRLVTATQKFATFIAENVLWIRNTTPLDGSEVAPAWETVQWLLAPENWEEIGKVMARDTRGHPLATSAVGVLLVLLLVFQGRLRQQLKRNGEQAAKSYSAAFAPTAQALGITLLLALTGPLPIWFIAWRLNASIGAETSDFVSAVANGLQVVSLVFLIAGMMRHVCRERGLAEAHFGWQSRALQLIRRSLRWFIAAGLPLVFMVAALESCGRDSFENSLGRIALIGGLGLLAFFLHRLLNPTRGVLVEVCLKDLTGWLNRLRWVWYAVAIGTPLALAALAAEGYSYTALQLAIRLKGTVWLGIISLLVYATLLRWLLITRRQLSLEQARKRRSAAQAEAAEGNNAPAPAEPEMDLSTINAQTRRLLRGFVGLAFFGGLWLIWVDVLPALAVFRQIDLWSTMTQIAETVPSVDGTTTTTVMRVVNRSITLADALVALVIVCMTITAGRNIPGVLEIAVLQRLPLDSGGRYAITTVSRYLITILGLVLAFGAIGIGWANVQWLAAAITVGLGFGLQEIFANFISGIILLLERPIRIGDTITIGDVTGVVSRIRIRSTNITDADRKELIVPNKELITGKLLNWTLSDPTLRVVIRIGVAYGTDAAKVQQMLIDIARHNPLVLRDPPPTAILETFGDSSLDFALRAYVPAIEQLVQVRHELNVAVDRRLREAGIEVSFPQYDIHVRTFPRALRVRPGRTQPAGLRGAPRRRSA